MLGRVRRRIVSYNRTPHNERPFLQANAEPGQPAGRADTAFGLWAVSSPAAAHGDDGRIEIVAAEPAGDVTVAYERALTYLNDGDPADGATVTLAVVGPVTLEGTGRPGRYAAAVTYPAPGQWAIRLSSLSPTATVTLTDIIASATSPTPPPTARHQHRPAPPSAETRPDPTPAVMPVPAPTQPATTLSTPSSVPATDSDDSNSTWPWILSVIAAAGLVAVAAAAVRRRRSAG